ncbi:protein of unknown function [Vibrio tapetis subsp. tapetis]|uniref:Uncharacterized protein n=1 Tax=Vibrio tapetis subsp. tapetis TaxID=1671868 RepID=A0A2N8ZDA6_9VIBR|nr:protein of unknown function [Vibrio tapetis subsp. tapetis]
MRFVWILINGFSCLDRIKQGRVKKTRHAGGKLDVGADLSMVIAHCWGMASCDDKPTVHHVATQVFSTIDCRKEASQA